MTPERIDMERLAQLRAMCDSGSFDNVVLVLRLGLADALDEIERLRKRPQGAIWKDLVAEIGRLQAELTRRDGILEQDLLK